MKISMVALILLSLFLLGCGVEFGGNYEHLQEQDPTGLRRVDLNEGTSENVRTKVSGDDEVNAGGLYDYLHDNLCELSPECCGKLTNKQKDLRDIERRAIVENNEELCNSLPNEPFIISCGNDFEEDVVLYSKQRCLDYFKEASNDEN